ncbi:MAG: ATP-binding protein [Sarcina sp.]
MDNKKKEIMYVEKSFFYEMLVKTIGALLFMLAIYFLNPLMSKKIIIIMNIVIIFSIMFFSIITFSFSENGFFSTSAFCYILIGILKIIELIYYNGSAGFISNIGKLIEALYIFIVVRYFRESFDLISKAIKDKKIDYFMFALTIIIFFLSLINYSSNLNFYYKILILFMFFDIMYYISRFPVKLKNQINYFSVAVVAIFISNGVTFFIFLDGIEAEILMECFSFFAYFLIYLAFSYKLLKKPSENLFTELYSRKQMLEEINNEINLKNLDLENKQMELKNDENIFKSIYFNIAIPLAIINKKNRIIYINSKFKDVLEKNDTREIINKNIFTFVDVMDFLKNSKISLGNKHMVENVIIKNNRTKVFNVNVINMEKDENILIFHDITREKRIEKIKKDYEKKIIEEKMKNDFLSNISHDIKAPINVIYSALQLENMLIKEEKIEELKKYNHINKENILAISRLANNLIDSSKLSNNYLNPNMEVLNIVELIEDSCNCFVEYMKNKNLKFCFDTDEEEVYIKCDRELMERVVINIISNSIKYTFEGEITVKIYIKNRKVIIEFKDTGIGISEELMENVFNKYSMGKKSLNEFYKNTGIGLYVVQNLVKIQKGTIILTSKENVGTTIKVEFFLEFSNGDLNYDVI